MALTKGQADNYEGVEICQRSYDILVGIGFPPGYHLRFKYFPVATGMEEHRLNALDF
jgi:5-methyltetrahydrofolate--homocysteine methyltransferase